MSDGQFRLDLEALARAVADDRAAGLNPIAVCANAGATGTGAIDPLDAMADYCRAQRIWLHVDAAYGGFAVLADAGRELLRGIERADSIGLDAHKWLFQPYEVSCLRVNPRAETIGEPALQEINQNVLARIFWEDNAFISSTRLKGTFALRLCIINHNTTRDDVAQTLAAIERFGSEALSAD